jgi:hypothetical protein
MELLAEVVMRADRVEVTWDAAKTSWLVRIVNGEEVIRRHCDLPKNSDEQTLRSAVQKTLKDEGFESDPMNATIHAE